MKKLFLPLVAFFFFASCEDIEREQPALLAYVDNIFYDSNNVRGYENEEAFVIVEGTASNRKITLRFKSPHLIDLPLGGTSSNQAEYEDASGNVYTTGPNATGEIKITNRTSGRSLTGNFSFTAISATQDTIVINNGFFYEVPTRTIIVENP